MHAPTPVILGTTTYYLAPFSKGLQDEYKQWMIGNAKAAAAEMSKTMTATQYANVLASISKQVATGAFNFLGEVFLESIGNMDGLAQFIHLLMRDVNEGQDVSVEACQKFCFEYAVEIGAALKEVFAWYFQQGEKFAAKEQSKKKIAPQMTNSVALT